MNFFKVSIIIPVAQGNDYQPATIESVLQQTYPTFELIVVDRTASHQVAEQLSRFHDQRIIYVCHEQDGSTATAVRAGLQAATGELITFLAPGDTFHPEKLQLHVAFLTKYADIGATCNSRIETDAAGMHLALWQPALPITLADLVLGLPLSLNDLVMRKEWLTKLLLTNNSETAHSGGPWTDERDSIPYQLALAACHFACLPSALNRHPYLPLESQYNVDKAATAELERLEAVFADRRCPPDVKILHDKALGRANLRWSYQAFLQHETALGQSFIRNSIQHDRMILDVEGRAYLEFLVFNCIRGAVDPEALLQRQLAQLPPELAWLMRFKDKTVALGHLHQGVRSIIWGRLEQGNRQITRAAFLGAQLDRRFLYHLLSQLLAYESEFGPQATEFALSNLVRSLVPVDRHKRMWWLRSRYFADRAFRNYQQSQHRLVPLDTLKALCFNPTYIVNRGVWSIFLRSLVHLSQQQPA